MSNSLHVVPHDGERALRRQGAERVSKIFDTQREAIKYGTGVAQGEGGELFIHRENGRFRDRNTYGHDPFPPRG